MCNETKMSKKEHTYMQCTVRKSSCQRLNHGPAGHRVGRTYNGLILAELIGEGRQRQTDGQKRGRR